jgi:hypothetical protein
MVMLHLTEAVSNKLYTVCGPVREANMPGESARAFEIRADAALRRTCSVTPLAFQLNLSYNESSNGRGLFDDSLFVESGDQNGKDRA